MTRYKLLVGLAFFCMGAFLFHCSKDVSGPENYGPVIDTIFSSPDSVLPGAKAVLSAVVTEPDGDSLIYRWSTYPAAAKFSDTAAPVCTLTVSTVLVGGMSLKVTLRVSEGKNEVSKDRWITLVDGELIQGHVYYFGTKMPIPDVEISIGQLVDTNRFSDGSYSIKHVPPGEQTIVARLLACESCCDSYAANVIVAGTDTLDHDIFLSCADYTYHVTGTVMGCVLDNDTIKLENVRVTVINPDETETGLCDTTDQDSRFSIEGVPDGFRSFAIEDVGSPVYEVLPQISWYDISADREVAIKVETKRTYVISDGISDTTGWILNDDGLWKRWVVDSINDCFSFNTCLNGTYGKIGMADDIPIPSKARNLTVTVDFGLENAHMYIAYVVDGQESLQNQFFAGTADQVFDIDVDEAGVSPAGHDFRVLFYIEPHTSSPCGSACLRYMEISYILPRY